MSCCYSPVEEKREISEGNGGQRVERHNGGWVGGYNDSRSMGRSTESCDSWLWPVSTAWFGIEPWAFLGTFGKSRRCRRYGVDRWGTWQ